MGDSAMTVQQLYERFGEGDLDAVFALLDPQIEWQTPPTLPWSRGTYRGHAAVREYFLAFNEALVDPRLEPAEFVENGEKVVVLGCEGGTCRKTGAGFEVPFAHAFWLRDGRVTRMRGHIDTAAVRQAFEAGANG